MRNFLFMPVDVCRYVISGVLCIFLLCNVNRVFAQGITVSAPTQVGQATHNLYYLNNNFSPSGNPLAGQLNPFPFAADGGPMEFGTTLPYLNWFDTETDLSGQEAAKSACMLGGKIFFTGDDAQGIRRMDDWAGTNLSGFAVPINPGTESICTDGTYLYGNDDVTRNRIFKWSPTLAGPLLLTIQAGFPVNVGAAGGRIRGISWYDWSAAAGDEYIYVSNGGDVGAFRDVFAVNTTTGAVSQIQDVLGNNITVPGAEAVYGVIVWRSGSCSYLIAVTGGGVNGYLYVWQLSNAAQVYTATPQTLDKIALGLGAFNGDYFGVSAQNTNLWLINADKLYSYTISPLPYAPPPTALNSSGVGCTGFTASWTAPVVGPVTNYTLEVSLDPAHTSPIAGSPFTVAGTVQNITGLTAGTTYYFRVRSNNACGSSAFTGNQTVTTNTVSGVPTGLNGSGVGCTGFTANWTAPAGPVPTDYTLEVSLDALHTSPVLGSPFTVVGTSQNITGLTAGTTYYFRVRSNNACGSSAFTANQTVTTNGVSGVPTGLSSGVVNCTDFTASWTAPAGPVPTDYTLEVSLDALHTSPVAGSPFTVAGTTQNITGLTAGTTYYFRVRSNNVCGSSAFTVNQTVTTSPLPAVPVALAASLQNCTDFTANWNLAANATGYRLDVATDAALTLFVPGYNDKPVAGTSDLVTGLTPGTTYYYRVRGENACGVSANSLTISTTTLSLPPAPASFITLPNPVCQGQNYTYTVTAVAGATSYNWTVPAPWVLVSGAGTNSITVTAGATGPALSVAAVNSCGAGPSISTGAITVNTVPAMPGTFTGIPPVICAGDVLTISAGVSAGAVSYNWTLPAGWTPATATTVTPNLGGIVAGATGGVIQIVANNSCGASSARTQTVTVTPIPAAPAAMSASAVNCTDYTLSWAAVTGATSYRLDVATDAAFTSLVVGYNNKIVTATTDNITGLSANTTYYARLRAVSACGISGNSPTTVTTTGNFAGTPVALAGTLVGCTGFMANWNAAAFATGGYEIDVANDVLFSSLVAGYNALAVADTFKAVTGLTAGNTYYYRVRGVNGCGVSANSNVVNVSTLAAAPLPFVITASGPTSFCSGGSVTLSVPTVAGVTYQWLLDGIPVGTNSAALLATAGGVYSATMTNSCGTTTASNTITVNSILTAPPVAPTVSTICAGSSTSITVTGTGVEWFATAGGGAPFFVGNTYTTPPLMTTTTYYVRFGGACPSTRTPVIVPVTTAPAAPTITANGSTSFCAGGSVVLSVPLISGASYQWQLNSVPVGTSSPVFNASSAGVYRVQITNACGSIFSVNTITVTVTLPPTAPAITAGGPTSFCAGGSVTLSIPPQTGVLYEWRKDGVPVAAATTTNNTFIAVETGNYTVFLQNSCGNALSTNSIAVAVSALPVVPTIAAGGSTTFCNGGSVTLSTTAQTGMNYRWRRDSVVVGTNSPQYIATQSGNYTVEVYNGCGSVLSGNSIHVSVENVLAASNATISVTGATTFCAGGSVSLAVPFVSGAVYQWYKDNLPIGAGGNRNEFIAVLSGNYTVSVTNSCGTVSSAAGVSVNARSGPAAPTISANGPTRFCRGDSVSLGVIAQPGVKYQWKRNGEIIAIDVNQVSVAETGVYTVAVFDSCGLVNASNSISIQVVEKLAPPTITVDGNPVLCEGGNVSLRVPASLGISYQWKRDGVVIPGATGAGYRATASGSYTVEVRNACGATLSENSIAVTVQAKPEPAVITANGPITFCPGGSVVLSVPAAAGVSYQWRWFGTVVGTNTNSYLATVPGSYSVVLSNSCGIVSSANTIEVGEIQTPVPVIREKNLVLTVSVEGVNYVWLDSLGMPVPNASGPQFVPTVPGFYRVAVTFANGCTRTSEAVYWPGATLGVTNELNDMAITVYPVPAVQGAVLQLRFEGNYAMLGSPDFVLYNASGGEVMRGKLTIHDGAAMINTEKLAVGNYMLVLADRKIIRIIISQ